MYVGSIVTIVTFPECMYILSTIVAVVTFLECMYNKYNSTCKYRYISIMYVSTIVALVPFPEFM